MSFSFFLEELPVRILDDAFVVDELVTEDDGADVAVIEMEGPINNNALVLGLVTIIGVMVISSGSEYCSVNVLALSS